MIWARSQEPTERWKGRTGCLVIWPSHSCAFPYAGIYTQAFNKNTSPSWRWWYVVSDRGFACRITAIAGGVETSEIEKDFGYMEYIQYIQEGLCFGGMVLLICKAKKCSYRNAVYIYVHIQATTIWDLCTLSTFISIYLSCRWYNFYGYVLVNKLVLHNLAFEKGHEWLLHFDA